MANEHNPAGNETGGGTGANTGAGTGAGPGDSQSKVEATKAHLKQAADDLREAATAQADKLRHKAEDVYGQARQRAEEYYGEARTRAEQAYGEARERARTFQEDGEAYVRENPLRAVMVALGAGFILGILFRR